MGEKERDGKGLGGLRTRGDLVKVISSSSVGLGLHLEESPPKEDDDDESDNADGGVLSEHCLQVDVAGLLAVLERLGSERRRQMRHPCGPRERVRCHVRVRVSFDLGDGGANEGWETTDCRDCLPSRAGPPCSWS